MSDTRTLAAGAVPDPARYFALETWTALGERVFGFRPSEARFVPERSFATAQ